MFTLLGKDQERKPTALTLCISHKTGQFVSVLGTVSSENTERKERKKKSWKQANGKNNNVNLFLTHIGGPSPLSDHVLKRRARTGTRKET